MGKEFSFVALVILQIGVIYFLGHFFLRLFDRYKVPDVLILMMMGLMVGPVLGFAEPQDFGRSGTVLSILALLVILFQSGVTLNLKALSEVFTQGSLLTITTFALTGTLAFLVSWPIFQDWRLSVLAGVITAGTSSAVVIPMSQTLKLSERSQNVLLLESSLTDVLCIVLTLSLARAFSGGVLSASKLFGEIGLSFLIAILVGGAVGAVWSHYKSRMKSLATIAVIMIAYGAVEVMGFSGPIAVMSMGFAMANTQKFATRFRSDGLTGAEQEFYAELGFILKVFFFIYLGISLKLDSVLMVGAAVLLTAGVVVARFGLVRLLMGRDGQGADTKEMSYVTLLVPKGLAAAVLAEVPLQQGIAGAEKLPSFVYSVVFISILLISIAVFIVGRRAVQ